MLERYAQVRYGGGYLESGTLNRTDNARFSSRFTKCAFQFEEIHEATQEVVRRRLSAVGRSCLSAVLALRLSSLNSPNV
jgi:hypothetical protein